MSIERDDAIVLGRTRLGETSLIVSLFTKRRGPVRAVAKGARRPRSRFGGVLEPTNVVHAVIYRKESRDLHLLSQADVVRGFGGLRESLLRLVYGYAIIECLVGLKREETPADRLFSLALAGLGEIESGREDDLEQTLWGFLLAALADAGYRPELERCHVCGKPFRSGPARFDPRAGGLVCSAHAEGGLFLSQATVDAFRLLAAGGRRAEPLEPREVAEGREALRRFLVEHGLGRTPFRSLDLIGRNEDRRKS